MEEGFPFSSLDTNFLTISYITTPQLTGFTPDSKPKMVLEIVNIIHVGFFGYRIETMNSKTLHSLRSSQSTTVYLSLGFMGVENLHEINFSVRDAHLLPSLGKLYTFAHSSAVADAHSRPQSKNF